MAIFAFDDSYLLGRVRQVDTRKVIVHVENNEDLRKARVSHLVALKLPGAVEGWLIGLIDRVTKSVGQDKSSSELPLPLDGNNEGEIVVNTVQLTLVGTLKWDSNKQSGIFSRSIVNVPEIDSSCYILIGKQLENFMLVLSAEGDHSHSLKLGQYTIDENAAAYIDGNKLFQRHAALVGSTGSGKSWTVATILERASKLPSSNLIVFDLHGEYRKLSYARHLRVPGPEDLGMTSEGLLYLPYWLLNAEELQAMFIDRTEFSAHNQVMAFQDAVIQQKREFLLVHNRKEVLAAFTLDSPIPFSLDKVIGELNEQNEEMGRGRVA